MTARAAIVLAAGSGSRFGGGKLLAPYRQGRLIDGALACAFAAPIQEVIVVTGFDRDGVGAVVGEHADRHPGLGCRIVHAADFGEGIAASVRTGFGAVSKDVESAFVILADMPSIPPSMAGRLAEAIGPHAAAAPVCRGLRGHPVLIDRRLFSKIFGLTGDQGARRLLENLGDQLVLIETDDEGVLFDVDTPSDLSR